MELLSVNTRELKTMLSICMESNLVPMIHGSPGIGKSAVTHGVSDDYQLQLIDHRLSTAAPEDQTGLPFRDGDRARFMPFADLFPIAGDKIPTGKQGWLLFLDEINSAPKSVMASAYKLILDRMTGQHKLHENVAIIAAGNLKTDRAITNDIGTALQSRMVHLELRVDHKIWMEDVALAQNYDDRIIGFLSMFPDKLMDFRPDHNDRTFCCPRTWEFMNRMMHHMDGSPRAVTSANAALYAGTITSGVATEFLTYCKHAADLVSLEDVLKAPAECRVPYEAAVKYATTTHLLSSVKGDTLAPVLEYITRYDASFKIMFARQLAIRHPTLAGHPAFAQFLSKMTHLLNA
ncbi:ATPase [Stenotrophomonas phage Pokken]|uniref:P-loop NTPase n=1 Tax=Stenotrophomonas phage Pokken TaxID=2596674 RepID=A0A5B9N5M4_9CAUD|nr:ATPase [Stenotrophomonas phage Pokken]QEG09254.1 P-loop NTPase [Stenotrophomonas phage Pokken]